MTVPEAQDLEPEPLGQFEGLTKIVRVEQEGPRRLGMRVATGIPGQNLGVPAQDHPTGLLASGLAGMPQDAHPDPGRNGERPFDLELRG